jgi:hypothetical protein
MKFQLDDTWKSCPIPVGAIVLEGFCRKGGSLDEACEFIEPRLASVVAEGGVLLRHGYDPVVTREIIDERTGLKGYQYALPEADLWYLPKCSFEQSLGLLDTFAFPSQRICLAPARGRKLVKDLLLDLSQNRRIAIVNMMSEGILVELIDKDMPFTTPEMTRVLKVNESEFGVKHSKGFWLDLRKHFRKKGFFALPV